jgi:hypothetical protein
MSTIVLEPHEGMVMRLYDPAEGVRPPPAKQRRVRLPSVKSVERATGKTVSALTVARDGARTYMGNSLGRPDASELARGTSGPVQVFGRRNH